MDNEQVPVLRQSVRWGERYVSSALNKKHAGILPTGVFHGFRLRPGAPMKVLVDHDPDYPRSVAVVERDGYSLTIIMEGTGYVPIPAPGKWHIVIEAFYIETQVGYQRIVAREKPEKHHVILGVVTVPAGSQPDTIITNAMIDTSARQEGKDLTNANIDFLSAVVEELRHAHEVVWTCDKDVVSDSLITLPNGLKYMPGENLLDVYWEGLNCAAGSQYEEVAGDPLSDKIKILFTAPRGSELRVLVRPFSLQGLMPKCKVLDDLEARVQWLETRQDEMAAKVPFIG